MGINVTKSGTWIVDWPAEDNRSLHVRALGSSLLKMEIVGAMGGSQGQVCVNAEELTIAIFRARGLTKFEGTAAHEVYQRATLQDKASLVPYLYETGQLTNHDLSLLLAELPPYYRVQVRKKVYNRQYGG